MMSGVDRADEQRQIDQVVSRLTELFPYVPDHIITETVDSTYRRFDAPGSASSSRCSWSGPVVRRSSCNPRSRSRSELRRHHRAGVTAAQRLGGEERSLGAPGKAELEQQS